MSGPKQQQQQPGRKPQFFPEGPKLDMRHQLKSTIKKQDVPLLFRDSYVETGFRQLHQRWSYYILSLFQWHNECMNSWTHLIALCCIIVKLVSFSMEFNLYTDPYMWPLLAGLFTMIVLYLCSSLAHCLQSRSEIVHYTCFMIDYAGIGLYGTGSVILHYTYCMDHVMQNSAIRYWAVILGVFLGTNVCLCCSISKTLYRRPYPFTRKLWQLGSVTAIYTWLILPIALRIYYQSWHDTSDLGLLDHKQQIIWFLSAGFFFGSEIPERFFPGYFDFLGHSHQLFHMCIMMVSCKQLDGIYQDIKTRRAYIYYLEPPTFCNTFGAVLLTAFMNAMVVLIFRQIARRSLIKENLK